MNDLVRIEDRHFRKYILDSELAEINARLASEMNEHYKGKKPIIISVLDGAFMFTADVIRGIDFEHELVFVKLSSYVDIESSGEVKVMLPLNKDISGRDVIIIEDIVDTGTTLSKFIKLMTPSAPTSIQICSLLFKPEALRYELPLGFIGKEIPNDFVIGYGLDVNGEGRNLKDIYKLHED